MAVHIQRVGVKKNVPSGTVINYEDMLEGGQFIAYMSDGTTQVGVKGNTTTAIATEVHYQLAEEIRTYYPYQTLIAYPNGTIFVDFRVKETKTYNNGIVITNQTIPIKSIGFVNKITDDGKVSIPLSSVTVAGNKLSITITGAVNGEVYEVEYEYDSSLSTIPQLKFKYLTNARGVIDMINSSSTALLAEAEDTKTKLLSIDTRMDNTGALGLVTEEMTDNDLILKDKINEIISVFAV